MGFQTKHFRYIRLCIARYLQASFGSFDGCLFLAGPDFKISESPDVDKFTPDRQPASNLAGGKHLAISHELPAEWVDVASFALA
jgi:hypothetical protein